MTGLDTYLSKHFLDEAQLTAAAAIGVDELNDLIGKGMVPEPSYTVSVGGKVKSFVFGEMEAPGSRAGRYFHPAQPVWIARARMHAGASQASLKQQFTVNFAAALAELDRTTWRLHDSFDDAGVAREAGLQARADSAWKYFLNGTFGLCVADAASEASIARKEVLQEKLTQLSENGSKARFSPDEARELAALIDAYAGAAMPFSPIEYSISSRKRLVEDLLPRLDAVGR